MSYPVGTICILQKLRNYPELNGQECEIISPPIFDQYVCAKTGEQEFVAAYKIRLGSNEEAHVQHQYLKRKDRYDEEKRAEDRKKVRDFLESCKTAVQKAIEAEAKQ